MPDNDNWRDRYKDQPGKYGGAPHKTEAARMAPHMGKVFSYGMIAAFFWVLGSYELVSHFPDFNVPDIFGIKARFLDTWGLQVVPTECRPLIGAVCLNEIFYIGWIAAYFIAWYRLPEHYMIFEVKARYAFFWAACLLGFVGWMIYFPVFSDEFASPYSYLNTVIQETAYPVVCQRKVYEINSLASVITQLSGTFFAGVFIARLHYLYTVRRLFRP